MGGFIAHVGFAQNSEYPRTAMKIAGEIVLPFLDYDLFVQGSHAYAAAGNNRTQNQLIVIDISNPENLQEIGYCPLSDIGLRTLEGGDAYGAQLQWPYFFHPMQDGLEIVDVLNAQNPSICCYYEIPEESKQGGVVRVCGNVALFSHARNGLLEILDLTDIRSPRRIAMVDLEDDPSIKRVIEARTIDWDGGRYAYIDAGCNTGMGIMREQLIVLDLRDIGNPVIASRILCDNGNRYGNRMIRNGDRLFYPFFVDPRRYSGIQIIDIRDPLSPILQNPVPTKDTIYTVYSYLEGFLAFAPKSNQSLLNYYRMNDQTPVKVLEYQFPCELNKVLNVGADFLGVGSRESNYYFYVFHAEPDSGISNFLRFR